MDAGDSDHILIAESLAETLLTLKIEYRHVIRLISNTYKIKHGQTIKLYTSHSYDFGIPQIPPKALINK